MELDELKELINFLEKKDFAEIEYENQGVRIRLRKAEPAVLPIPPPIQTGGPAEQVPHAPLETPQGDGALTVEAPMVGTFYRAPSPEADPFVDEGDVVEKGRVLCIIEAMKIMNEIESEVQGRVKSIMAENGQPVGYGDALFIVEPL